MGKPLDDRQRTKALTKCFCLEVKVPIFDSSVRVIVTENIAEARQAFADVFGPSNIHESAGAMCSWNGPKFGLFYQRASMSPGTIAHELYHLTSRILDWRLIQFGSNNDELGASLNDYLTDVVYAVLEKDPWRKLQKRKPSTTPLLKY